MISLAMDVGLISIIILKSFGSYHLFVKFKHDFKGLLLAYSKRYSTMTRKVNIQNGRSKILHNHHQIYETCFIV